MLDKAFDFPSQIARAHYLANDSISSESFRDVDKIIFLGMGGSGVLGDSIGILLKNPRIPVHVWKSSLAPNFVDSKSLVIAVSYSGKTWETLAAMRSCIANGAKLAVISSSTELISDCKIQNIPAIKIPENGQARASFGYLLVSTLNLLHQAGLVAKIDEDLAESTRILNDIKSECTSGGTNIVHTIVHEFLRSFPVIYGEHNFTDVVALRWKQLLNENSKAHCYYDVFPELLHNEIEVWNSSAHNIRDYSLVLLRDLKHEKEMRIMEKVDATKLMIAEKKTTIFEVWSRGESELARILSLNYVGELVSIYLAIAKNIDPSTIPNILRIKGIGLGQRGNQLL